MKKQLSIYIFYQLKCMYRDDISIMHVPKAYRYRSYLGKSEKAKFPSFTYQYIFAKWISYLRKNLTKQLDFLAGGVGRMILKISTPLYISSRKEYEDCSQINSSDLYFVIKMKWEGGLNWKLITPNFYQKFLCM